MTKILIVDDEMLVRIGLVSSINWENHGFQIVGQAKNGNEAIKLFEKFNPDIVITDIGMPVLGGLELIHHLIDTQKYFKSIILTHHNDFNYAKKAIELGVSYYILKSEIDTDYLIHILTKLASEINEKRGPSAKGAVEDTHGAASSEAMAVIADAIVGDVTISSHVQKLFMEKWPLSQGTIAVIRFACEPDSTVQKKQHHMKIISNILHDCFSKSSIRHGIMRDPSGDGLVVFLNHNDLAPSLLTEQFSNISSNIKQLINLVPTIGISRSAQDFCNLHELYHQAVMAEKSIFFHKNAVMRYDSPQICLNHCEQPLEIEPLLLSLSVGNKDDTRKYLRSLIQTLANSKSRDLAETTYDALKTSLLDHYSQMMDETVSNMGENDLPSFGAFHAFDELTDYLVSLINRLSDLIIHKIRRGCSFVIRKCIRYLESHYNENISLSELADLLQISKSYLSFLFKQETGINYSTYLNSIRIRHSKELLQNSNYKIYEIADMVGFDNPYYFSKVFKDMTSMTCKDFRKHQVLQE